MLPLYWTLVTAYWPLVLLVGVATAAQYAHALWERQRLLKSGIAAIDEMDGLTFEKYLEALFIQLGYQVERTPYTGDFGADLIVCKAGVKTAVQAKRWKNTVGIAAVQQAYAARTRYQCTEAMVVTTNTFTRQAKQLATDTGVKLWDRNQLIERLLMTHTPGDSQTCPVPPSTVPPNLLDPVCAQCGVVVSEKVQQYCLTHHARFGGQILCYAHQRRQQ